MSPFNLIHESWLPLRRRSGTLEWVPPWCITDRGGGGDDPFVTVDPSRPDLRGALVQFLVGLLQTAWPPRDEDAWLRAWERPPSPRTLKRAFQRLSPAFDLDGDGPRFMQVELPAEAEAAPVALLLMDQPEVKKERENKDLFVKRGQVDGMCRSCLAAALYCLQTFASGGGRGHLTSLRGGGPLSTMVLGRDLWQTLWLAVLPADDFWTDGPPDDPLSLRIFPWLGLKRTSEAKPIRLTPLQADPVQVYWGMPRRIRLELDQAARKGVCPVCGREDQELFSHYRARPLGIKYEGAWRHPLSPYYRTNDTLVAVKGQPGGICYRHWLGLVLRDGEGKRLPAQVVWRFTRKLYGKAPGRELASGGGVRLWAYGFDMDNKKARGWVDSEMPLVSFPPDKGDEFEYQARALVLAADHAANTLAACLKSAWFSPDRKVKVNQGALPLASEQLYHHTEADFYRALHRVRDLLERGIDPDGPEFVACKEDWVRTLRDTALEIFRQQAQAHLAGPADPRRIALARNKLAASLNPRAHKKLRELMELPSPTPRREVHPGGQGGEA